MTELYIDGIQVVLPKGFTVQVKTENPFITKNGEYTYDLTLSLTNSINADLYRHLHRLNSVSEVTAKRDAVLIADHRVYCRGTEVITAWTNDSVTIQIASGNSQLNYVIGANLQISSLPMKSTHLAGMEEASIQQTFPDIEFNTVPIFDEANGELCNNWYIVSGNAYPTYDAQEWRAVPQPYLCAYINEVVRALGYTMVENQLESSVYKHLYICQCHTRNGLLHTGSAATHQWSEMLPGWKVMDFLTEIEKIFNMVFVVNNRTREMSLVARVAFYNGSVCSHVRQVIDVYETELDDEPDGEDPTVCNVTYSLEDDEFWHWRCLSDSVKSIARHENIPADYTGQTPGSDHGYISGGRVLNWFMDAAHQRTDTIYRDAADGREYLFMSKRTDTNTPIYTMLNEFEQLTRENPAGDIELSIAPSTMRCVDVPQWTSEESSNWGFYLPVFKSGEKMSEEVVAPTLIERITNSITDTEPGKSNLRLAFYTGPQRIMIYNGAQMYYCIPFIDEYTIVEQPSDRADYRPWRMSNTGASLRLKNIDAICYHGGYEIAYHKACKVTSYDPNVYDARTIFEIRNKRFICKEIEYTLTEQGRKGAWSGTFFPIKISDTETDNRWILTDGKWRDGGVWIDNGRWLDS